MKSFGMKVAGIFLMFTSYIQVDCAIVAEKSDIRDHLMWAAIMNMCSVVLIARSFDEPSK